MNLLISDFYRFVKDKVLYILLGALAGMTLIMCIVFNGIFGESERIVSDIITQCLGLDILGIIVGIAVALFCGKDYDNNTIRNKICCGEGRYKIYFTKLIESVVIATVFFFFTMLCSLIFGAMFFKFEFADEFFKKIMCEWLLLIGFTAIVNCLCVTTKSSKSTIIFTVIQFLVLNAIARMLPTMGEGIFIEAICRILYFSVSVMMLGANNGVYTATIKHDGQITAVQYSGMYLNSILLSLIYILLTVCISLLVIRKQEYK